MIPKFLFIFLIDIFFFLILGTTNAFLLLLSLIPWTISLYVILSYPGFRFGADNQLLELAGKLFWTGNGVVQGTILTILNITIGIILIPDSALQQFESTFGLFSSTFIFFILPFPAFIILNLQTKNQEFLYTLIYQEIVRMDETPPFVELTAQLISSKQKYTEEYAQQVEKVISEASNYLERNFPELVAFYDRTKRFSLNIENLAIFITKQTLGLP
ncbi:MAG: hypothetical protein EAX86_11395 [Candidatus Heimdallarchaeota archaeon]|nr:hypothetical protein [Candidatus Heimdallarchaeota archaeon]